VEAHPVVREYFAQEFQKGNPDGWREAHSRLFDYFEQLPDESLPSDIPDLIPLYFAVRHGCEAERYGEAMFDVYIRRICRGKQFYSKYELGAFGLDLAAISYFFERRWDRQIEATKGMGFLYNEAGACLASVLRMKEAIQAIETSWAVALEKQNLDSAGVAANTLSFHYLTMGEWKDALAFAHRAVEYAKMVRNPVSLRVALSSLAYICFHQGEFEDALQFFVQAERFSRDYPILYAGPGAHFCELLLRFGRWAEARGRASNTLPLARDNNPLQGAAFDLITLGRSYVAEQLDTGFSDLTVAGNNLEEAVTLLRKFGNLQMMPFALLARAEFRRATAEWDGAWRDLEETLKIARRGGLKLFDLEACYQAALLHLALGQDERAVPFVSTFRSLVQNTGYRHLVDNFALTAP
jgi:tetratricopeptide (TPR) repeat protein